MRVVLDTNVLVSFVLTKGETISRIFELWEKRDLDVLVNDEILVEVKQVMERLVGGGVIEKEEYRVFMQVLEKESEYVPSVSVVKASEDKKDNRFLACAKDGKADYVVSGDEKHLLSLGKFEGILIVSPKEFVEKEG